jgi:hypothetical protein
VQQILQQNLASDECINERVFARRLLGGKSAEITLRLFCLLYEIPADKSSCDGVAAFQFAFPAEI